MRGFVIDRLLLDFKIFVLLCGVCLSVLCYGWSVPMWPIGFLSGNGRATLLWRSSLHVPCGP